MTHAQTFEPSARKPLRVWPGVIAVALLWLFWFVLPAIVPDSELVGMVGGMACAVVVVIWWLFLSRASWVERLGAIAITFVAIYAAYPLVHPSIAGGMMGRLLIVFSVPFLCLALVVWAVVARRLSAGARRVALVAIILIAYAPWTLVRTAGVYGAGGDYHWRWTPTPEQLLLAQPSDDPKTPPPSTASTESVKEPPAAVEKPAAPAPVAVAPSVPPAAKTAAAPTDAPKADIRRAEWPGFRGPNRDSIVRGVRIETDWSKSAPVQLWRRPIGPGWSSFAVSGDLLYTQEQRGDDEIVACYRVSTGEPVWRHRDAVRFWESNGGAGPRGTPALGHGRVYTFGATGILNALNAATGAVVWSRNAASDTGRRIPEWGFTSSPLVIDDVVIVAASGTLAGYDAATGNKRWTGPSYGGSYSSPHQATIDGVVQVVLLGGPGAIGLAPASGQKLWEYAWSGGAITQPAVTADGDVLVNAITPMGGQGTRRLALEQGSAGWTVQERWSSTGLKPYFNDFVVHQGHAFGFDGNILACIDLADGKRKWKGGRYGNGQLVLLADQDLLLVLSEDGELALVGATSDQYREISRAPAIEGKTWNHPALVGDVLLVRNGEEMAAFRLPVTGR